MKKYHWTETHLNDENIFSGQIHKILTRLRNNMINKPQAFIFDMDGTLVDSMSFQFESWRQFFALHQADFSLEETINRVNSRTPNNIIADFFENKLNADEIPPHLDKRQFLFEEIYRENLAPIAGLTEFLQQAADRNIPVGLATGSDFRNINYTLDNLNIRRFFNAIVGADDIQRSKPDPESFLLAAEKLGIAPENCLVFEDSTQGIEAARRAGMKAVALTTLHTREELQQLENVVAIIDDYTDSQLAEILRATSEVAGKAAGL
jgi:beta-phosphoglucomutase